MKIFPLWYLLYIETLSQTMNSLLKNSKNSLRKGHPWLQLGTPLIADRDVVFWHFTTPPSNSLLSSFYYFQSCEFFSFFFFQRVVDVVDQIRVHRYSDVLQSIGTFLCLFDVRCQTICWVLDFSQLDGQILYLSECLPGDIQRFACISEWVSQVILLFSITIVLSKRSIRWMICSSIRSFCIIDVYNSLRNRPHGKRAGDSLQP